MVREGSQGRTGRKMYHIKGSSFTPQHPEQFSVNLTPFSSSENGLPPSHQPILVGRAVGSLRRTCRVKEISEREAGK